ncbi:MAG: hypothetical protein JWM85_482 [Acidimicrobiaceae bacterium]|nr:hypothetical protein [Acidimicrobiaceae bacterium]
MPTRKSFECGRSADRALGMCSRMAWAATATAMAVAGIATLAGGAARSAGGSAAVGGARQAVVASASRHAKRQASLPAQPGTSPERAAKLVHAVTPANAYPSPDFLNSCLTRGIDETAVCASTELTATNAARASEGLGALPLNVSSFLGLTPEEQLFALTNLERVSRGLPPFTALVQKIDAVALKGARSLSDPTLAVISPALVDGRVVQWGSNWAGGTVNPLGASYFWLYDDGPGGTNLDCTTANSAGCFGHRANILTRFSSTACGTGVTPTLLMGAAATQAGVPAEASLAEMMIEACHPSLAGAVITWTSTERILGLQARSATAG